MTAERHRLRRQALTPFARGLSSSLIPIAALALLPATAYAQSAADSATAQALFDHAKKLMSDGKYAEACPALEESERVQARSGTLLNLADCYEHAGRLASAWSSFLEAATLAKSTGQADREHAARERAAALAPKLSNLVVNAPSAASTPGIEITRDGERVGMAQLGFALPAASG
jgi:tetratricopeptide (TPR) repeat protein